MCVVVTAIHFEGSPSSHCHLPDEGHKVVGHAHWVLANRPRHMSPHRVEVAKDHDVPFLWRCTEAALSIQFRVKHTGSGTNIQVPGQTYRFPVKHTVQGQTYRFWDKHTGSGTNIQVPGHSYTSGSNIQVLGQTYRFQVKHTGSGTNTQVLGQTYRFWVSHFWVKYTGSGTNIQVLGQTVTSGSNIQVPGSNI